MEEPGQDRAQKARNTGERPILNHLIIQTK